MSSPHDDRDGAVPDQAMYAGEGRAGKQQDPSHRRAARGKAAAVIIGVVLLIFVVLLTIFMLASSSDGEGDAPSQSQPPSQGADTVSVLLTGR